MENSHNTPQDGSHSAQPQHNATPAQSAEQQQLSAILESAPFPIAVFTGQEMRISRANRAAIETWGKGPEVHGRLFIEVLPELKGQQIIERMEEVYRTGISYQINNSPVELIVDSVRKTYYFNYSITPLFDQDQKVYGVMNTAADVTDLVLAKKQLEGSEDNFRNMILQAPVAMCLLRGPEFIVDVANQAILEIWGKPKPAIMGRPVFQAIPEAVEQGLQQVMEQVYRTGIPFHATEQPVTLVRNGISERVYLNFVYQPYRNTSGEITGILALAVDVTGQVQPNLELERAYEQVQLSKTAAQLGTFDLDLEKGTMEWDQRCRELFGVGHNGPVSYEKDFVEGLHPDDRERITTIIGELLAGKRPDGDYDVEYRTVGQTDHQLRWVRAKGRMFYENGTPKRFAGSVLDITAQKQVQLTLSDLARKQGQLAAVVNSSDDIIISKTLEGIITSWNPAAERIFGYSESEAIGCHISIIIPPERLTEEAYIIGEIKSGNKVDHFETVRHGKDKKPVQLSITVSPVVDENGKIIGASKIARDISSQLQTQKNAKNYTERLEIMNMVMSAVSEELELNKILQKVTDATTELTGAQFGAFFYNKIDDKGESYTLFTFSGAPREAFEKFGMPRNTAVFHPTFSGEGVLRVDDITKDPRYGKNDPHFGMPKGHLPVVSYLAVPVTSREGNVIGGLFFGHPEPAKFTQEHETLVVSIAAQTAISLDNAKLFEEVRALNDKKDEFIGLASHELKTPLASINGYLQILDRRISEQEPKKFLEKALNQVKRITSLVNDLLDVSKIEAGKLQLTSSEFDLRAIIEESIELIQHSQAKQHITFQSQVQACPILGDAQRIEQVMVNLLGNAIKYAPKSDKVEVSLSCTDQNVTVAVRDYGPGIPKDKLGHIFSRFFRIDENTPNISGLGIGSTWPMRSSPAMAERSGQRASREAEAPFI